MPRSDWQAEDWAAWDRRGRREWERAGRPPLPASMAARAAEAREAEANLALTVKPLHTLPPGFDLHGQDARSGDDRSRQIDARLANLGIRPGRSRR
jgi:hypothetical protein